MSYTVLGDYLATKDKATVEQGFRQYIAIYGTDDIGNEAWPTYSFALLGKITPEHLGDNMMLWSIKVSMLKGFAYFNRVEYEGDIYLTYWYKMEDTKEVFGDKEYLDYPLDPLDVKAWFNKHFSNFVKQYISHEQDVETTQEGADITEV
jgi:hypothetical protein